MFHTIKLPLLGPITFFLGTVKIEGSILWTGDKVVIKMDNGRTILGKGLHPDTTNEEMARETELFQEVIAWGA